MEITRGQILRAAVELFLKQGYHDTKVSQIAEKIDKSTAVVFRAYPDKEAILYALVNHMFGSQFSNVRKKLGDDADQLISYSKDKIADAVAKADMVTGKNGYKITEPKNATICGISAGCLGERLLRDGNRIRQCDARIYD